MQVEVLSETRQRFLGQTYYLCGKYFQRKGVRLHREVWREAHGDIPEGYEVHHIDANRANNQLENLVRHKTNCRIFLIGNTVEECSDILTLFNFIPEQFGRFKLKKKRAIIDYIPPSKKYLERRKGSIADLLAPDASTFTNAQTFDRSKIYKGRVYKPQFVIQFRNQSFTVWDKNVVCRHNKENKPVVAMVPLLINNTVFRSELRDEVILMNYEKRFMFRDLLTQKLFDKCIKEVKGIKG